MSVSNEMVVDSRPHVWVQFDADEVKAFAPLNFIVKHPSNWRSKGAWDSSYLYKVFWSPNEEDSPSEMLKRVLKIPVYEKRTSMEKPGYYRASVLAVDESLEAVQKQVEGKRVSVGLLKYKYCSFDGSSNTTKSKTDKPHCREVKAGSKKFMKTQSKGFNHDAHVKDLNFEPSLETKYDFLKETSETSSGKVTDSTSASVSLRRSGRQGIKKKKDFSSDSDVEVPDSGDDSKKIKLDPSYTPKKTVDLEDKLKTATGNLERSYNRNKKLESDIEALQQELDIKSVEFNQEKARLEEKIRALQQKVCMLTNNISELQEQLECVQKKHQAANCTSCKCKVDSILQSGTEKEGVSLLNEKQDNFDYFDDDYAGAALFCEAALDCKSDATDNKSVKIELTGSVDKDKVKPKLSLEVDEEKVKMPQTDTTSKEQGTSKSKSDLMAESDYDGIGASEFKMQGRNQGYELCPGVVIAPAVWSALEAISKSEKKDKIFIKDLSLAAFGPEVLASSTICGTKKGGRKKKRNGAGEEAEEAKQEPKPGLNKLTLKAVREKFIERVEKNEGRKIDLPDDEPRTSLKLFNGAWDTEREIYRMK